MNLRLLKKICETPGAPGFENKVRDLVAKEIKPHVHDLRTDNMGNLIALIKGKERVRVMASAHLDEIGFIVTHIDDQGFIHFHTLGGFDPKTLTAQRVIIHGKKDIIGVMGSKPIHIMSPEEKTKAPKINDFFIDTGLTREELVTHIEIGCPITRERSLIVMGDNINCKSLDNRISVYILIEAIKRLKNPPYDFYAVFSVQEEVGIRGAQVAAHQINPDFGLGIDTTIAYDVPGAKDEEMVTKLGAGVAIKIMDASTICDNRMVSFLKESALINKIPFQLEILTAGGTDTASIQRMGKHGSIAGAISIPTRHIHQVIEMVNKNDVLSAIDLLCKAVNKINKFKWAH
jgi:endoglucanase